MSNLNLQKQLDLSKGVVLNLTKTMNFEGQKAQVMFCIDYSGSMVRLYSSGFVQKLTERLLPLGMAFDDNGSMEVFKFSTYANKVTDCTVNNIENFVNKHIHDGSWGGTNYAPAINAIVKEHKDNAVALPSGSQSSGGFFGAIKRAISGSSNMTQSAHPTYVVFITDGENFDEDNTRKAMIEASNHGVFFQFVGLCTSKNQRFRQLEELDNMSGRVLDNANFFKLTQEEAVNLSDNDLYSRLLNEYPSWLKQARQKGLIK